MRFTVKRAILFTAYKVFTTFLRKTGLPSFQAVNFYVSPKTLLLFGSDGVSSLTLRIPIQTDSNENGSFRIHLDALMSFLNSTIQKDLSIYDSHGFIKAENSDASAPIDEPLIKLKDFPETFSFSIDSAILSESLEKLQFFTENNSKGHKQLKGINFDFRNPCSYITATNAHFLGMRSVEPFCLVNDTEFTIPKDSVKIINLLLKYYTNSSVEVKVDISGSNVYFFNDFFSLCIKRLDFSLYPDCQRIIPPNTPEPITIPCIELRKALNVFPKKTEKVRVSFSDTTVLLESPENISYSFNTDSNLPNISLMLNYNMLATIIKQINEGDLLIYIHNSKTAVKIQPVSNPNYLYLIMPVLD